MSSLTAESTPGQDRDLFCPAPLRLDAAQLEQPEALRGLVAHRCALPPSLTLEAALAELRHHRVNFAAIVAKGRLLGQVSRHGLDEKLSGRFGFALHGRADVGEFATEPSLAVTVGQPIGEVLSAMHERPGAAFYDDVMLLDTAGQFLGFIDTRTLVQAQHELFLQKISHLAASTESLNRVNRELAETYKGLVDASRRAGMAEIATGVLHNVGNVLNSLNVSANVLTSGLRQSKTDSLVRLAAMLQAHAGDLGAFLTHDPKGRRIPEFIASLGRHATEDRDRLLTEAASLQHGVDHIKEIVAMQQAYASMVPVVEPLDPATLMEDALRMNTGAFERHGVVVERDFQTRTPVHAEKAKVLQILLNLIRNAKYACDERGHADKVITLRTAPAAGGRIQLIVADNGVGIPPENLTRIFRHGFTTRATGHGFGLHSSANAAREMKGSLTVHSAGPGLGATFTLELPAP